MELKRFINQNTMNEIENYLKLHHPPGLIMKGIKGLGIDIAGHYIASKLLKCSIEELNSNPDYFEVTENPIKIEDIDEMLEMCNINCLGNHRVVVIQNAETMSSISQNRLLKLLEDRASSNILILCTNKDSLISTIESRCYDIYFHPIEKEKMVSLLLEQGIEDRYHNFLCFLTENAPFLITNDLDMITDYIEYYQKLCDIKERKELLSLLHCLKEKDENEFFTSHEKYPEFNIRFLLFPFFEMVTNYVEDRKSPTSFPHDLYNFKQAVNVLEQGFLHLSMLEHNYTKNDYFNFLSYLIQV